MTLNKALEYMSILFTYLTDLIDSKVFLIFNFKIDFSIKDLKHYLLTKFQVF